MKWEVYQDFVGEWKRKFQDFTRKYPESFTHSWKIVQLFPFVALVRVELFEWTFHLKFIQCDEWIHQIFEISVIDEKMNWKKCNFQCTFEKSEQDRFSSSLSFRMSARFERTWEMMALKSNFQNFNLSIVHQSNNEICELKSSRHGTSFPSSNWQQSDSIISPHTHDLRLVTRRLCHPLAPQIQKNLST